MKKNKKQREAAKAVVTPAKDEVKKEVKSTIAPKPGKELKPSPTAGKEDAAKKLKDTAAAATVKKITEKKDLKYIYPEDIDDLPKRKKFRAEVRRKVQAMEKEIAKLQASGLEEDKKLIDKKSKAYDKYYKTVIAH